MNIKCDLPLNKNDTSKFEKLRAYSSRFNRVVLWGFKEKHHSHKYIHEGYFHFLNSLGVNTIWLDDDVDSNLLINKNDLVMIPDVHLKSTSHKFRDDVYYVLHHGEHIPELHDQLSDKSKVIFLYEYRKVFFEQLQKTESGTHLNEFIYFFKSQRVLLQPWGTNLLSSQFYDPIFNDGKDVFFVGSVWGDNEGVINGNRKIIENLGTACSNMGLELSIISNVSAEKNIELIRSSRLSISPGALGHNRYDYLQCRTFKNISYGQLTLTDVNAFSRILGGFYTSDLNELVAHGLSFSKTTYMELCREQQEKIKNYTYLDMWINIFRSFQDFT
jgi:hypothetical protein